MDGFVLEGFARPRGQMSWITFPAMTEVQYFTIPSGHRRRLGFARALRLYAAAPDAP